MRKLLVSGIVAYLLVGMLFAANAMPQQMWTCPDEDAPHGHVVYGDPAALPRDGCQPTETLGDRARWFAVAVPGWFPLLVGKGVSNTVEP